MKKIIASAFVGLLSGVTVYLLIDNLFERQSKIVNPSEIEDFEEQEESYSIPLTKDQSEAV